VKKEGIDVLSFLILSSCTRFWRGTPKMPDSETDRQKKKHEYHIRITTPKMDINLLM